MTTPDSFATAEDAAAYGYQLPASPDGLLARATQAIRDAAGIPLTQTTSTVQARARRGKLALPGPLVSSVTSITLASDGSDVTGYTWDNLEQHVTLPDTLTWRDRRCGLFQIVYVHGFAVIPAGLVNLTCAVAYRLAATPAAAAAGLKSKTVGSVSWTAGDTPAAALTAGELRQLGLIVPVPRAWQVAL